MDVSSKLRFVVSTGKNKRLHRSLQCCAKSVRIVEDSRGLSKSDRRLVSVFQEKIAQHYARLGRNQKKIADFLTQQYHEAAFINAFALSQRLGVDPATVTRFAQRLGYAGYPELLREIQAMVRKELSPAERPPAEKADSESLFLRALAQEKENLERAMTHIKGTTVAQVVSSLRGARNVYVVAQGLAKGPAQVFVSHLQGWLAMPIQLVTAEFLEAPMFFSSLAQEDVVMGVSLSALHDDTAEMLKLAQSRGAKTIGLAASHTSPIASTADLVVVYPSVSMTAAPSVASLTSVLIALFQALALQEPERLDSFQQGFQKNLNWWLEGRGEKKIGDADVLRQF
jgi:DNA-binding MurR/RpiR family transcriptional regulator